MNREPLCLQAIQAIINWKLSQARDKKIHPAVTGQKFTDCRQRPCGGTAKFAAEALRE